MGMGSNPFKPKRKVWRCKTRQQPSKQQTSVAHVLEAVSTPVKMSTLYDYIWCHFSSVQFSSVSVVSDYLRPHGLQYARPPCPSPTPGVYSNSSPLSQWCAIQPSHPLSSPPSPAFSLSRHQGLFKWVSPLHQVAKVLGVSASTSVPPTNTQDCSPLRWTGWISLQSKGLSRVFSNTTVQKHQFFSTQLSL